MTTLLELDQMNDEQIVQGYNAARQGYVLSGYESPSFVHGWRNGRVDFHGEPITTEQAQLARDYLKSQVN